jgi:hypothetical protein
MIFIQMVKRFLNLNSYKKRKCFRCGILFAIGKTGRITTVIAYEFYLRAENGEDEDRLIGVLPERRADPQRISHQSIMNWAKLLVAEKEVIGNRVYFNPIDIS